jgi:hypothetical protein
MPLCPTRTAPSDAWSCPEGVARNSLHVTHTRSDRLALRCCSLYLCIHVGQLPRRVCRGPSIVYVDLVGAALAPRWVRPMTSGIRRLLSARPRLARVDLPSDACGTACSWPTLRNADPSHFAFEAEYGASVGRVGDFAFHRSWSPTILSVSVIRQLRSGPLTTKTPAARRLVCGEMETPAVVA